jgi:hypothetical protein
MNAASRDRTQGDFDVSPIPLDVCIPTRIWLLPTVTEVSWQKAGQGGCNPAAHSYFSLESGGGREHLPKTRRLILRWRSRGISISRAHVANLVLPNRATSSLGVGGLATAACATSLPGVRCSCRVLERVGTCRLVVGC